MTARTLLSFVFVSLAAALAQPVLAAPSSSKSCREAWGGRDLAKFDWENDRVTSKEGNIGYAKYRARLTKAGIDRQKCLKDWTILVYMAGDNDLSPYALWDIDEMEGRFESGRYAGSTLKTDVIAQLDTAGPTGLRRLHIFQREDLPYQPALSVKEYSQRVPQEIASPIVKLIPEPNRQSPRERLQEFLEWGVKEYPAENYMVIVWGHGQGWTAGTIETAKTSNSPLAETVRSLSVLPSPSPGRYGGIMANPASGESLSIPDLREALRAASEKLASNAIGAKRFAVYASDACLMQMSEVAFEIAPFARFISGSAQVQTYLGLPYRRVLYELNTGRFLSLAGSVGKSDEALLMAKMLPVLSEKSLDPVTGLQGRADPEARKTFSMSSLSSDALISDLAPAAQGFSKALQAYLTEDFFRAADLSFVVKGAPSFMGGGKEFGSFLSLIEIARVTETEKTRRETKASKALAAAIQKTKLALDKTVIERRFGTDYQSGNIQFHLLGYRGLGVWIPNGAAEFRERSSDFALSSWEKQTGWQSWLKPALGIKP